MVKCTACPFGRREVPERRMEKAVDLAGQQPGPGSIFEGLQWVQWHPFAALGMQRQLVVELVVEPAEAAVVGSAVQEEVQVLSKVAELAVVSPSRRAEEGQVATVLPVDRLSEAPMQTCREAAEAAIPRRVSVQGIDLAVAATAAPAGPLVSQQRLAERSVETVRRQASGQPVEADTAFPISMPQPVLSLPVAAQQHPWACWQRLVEARWLAWETGQAAAVLAPQLEVGQPEAAGQNRARSRVWEKATVAQPAFQLASGSAAQPRDARRLRCLALADRLAYSASVRA